MKSFKRLVSVMLVSVLTASMAGCGSTNTTDASNANKGDSVATNAEVADTEVAVTEEEVGPYTVLTDANGDVYDLGGMEVVFADWWSSGEEEEPTNAYEEAQQEYYDWIQKTYNFTIKSEAFSSWGDMPTDFVNYATTGDDKNYIFCLRQGSELISALSSGLMYDLSSIDCLDFTEDKWKSKVHELMTIGDSIYGMRGIDPEPCEGIYFNKRLLEEAGIDPQTIYDMQEKNEWTWDKFEELCKQVQKDTDNDGVIDQYAMTNFTSSLYPAAVYSNGGSFINKDENGYYNNLESDETMEALNWALGMLDNYEMKYPEDAEWDYTYTAFENGEAVFSCAQVYVAGNWSEMEDDFGFVCFPMGPNATDYTNCYNNNVYVIPACYDAEKAWNLAFVYNLYTDPVPEYEDYASWKANYYSSFRDTESVDLTIARMMENGIITYHNMISGLDMGSDLLWGISDDSTPAQQAESIRNTWSSYIDKANGK